MVEQIDRFPVCHSYTSGAELHVYTDGATSNVSKWPPTCVGAAWGIVVFIVTPSAQSLLGACAGMVQVGNDYKFKAQKLSAPSAERIAIL